MICNSDDRLPFTAKGMVIATLEVGGGGGGGGGENQTQPNYNQPKLMQPKHECRSEKCQTTLP